MVTRLLSFTKDIGKFNHHDIHTLDSLLEKRRYGLYREIREEDIFMDGSKYIILVSKYHGPGLEVSEMKGLGEDYYSFDYDICGESSKVDELSEAICMRMNSLGYVLDFDNFRSNGQMEA